VIISCCWFYHNTLVLQLILKCMTEHGALSLGSTLFFGSGLVLDPQTSNINQKKKETEAPIANYGSGLVLDPQTQTETET
jgi:hypothetical protein